MAGFFGLFDYSKEGPGISKEGPQKKRFFLFFELYFRKFWKLVWLNFVYVICCIPIVTIGPATAGLTLVLRNFAREEHADTSYFFDAMKKNWKQGFVMGLIQTVFVILISMSLYLYANMIQPGFLRTLGMSICISAAIIYLFMSYYFYVMIVTFRLKIKQLIKNAFIFSCANLKTNLITTFWLLIIFLALFLFCNPIGVTQIEPLQLAINPLTFMIFFLLLVTILPTTIAFIINFNIYPKVKKLMIDPVLEEEREKKRAERQALNIQQENEEPIFTDLGRQEKPKDR